MRPTLFHIPLDGPWSLGPLGEVPGFGFGIVLGLWILVAAVWLWSHRRQLGWNSEYVLPVIVWLLIAASIIYLPRWLQRGPNRIIAATSAIISQQPNADSYYHRARAWTAKREYGKAAEDYRAVIRLAPEYAPAYSELAWLLATSPSDNVRDGEQAIEWATKACELTGPENAHCHDVRGAAFAEAGRFDDALAEVRQAASLANVSAEGAVAANLSDIRKRLDLYESRQPFRDRSAGRSIPVHGYGFMLVLGFFAAVFVGQRLARRVGMEPQVLLDMAVWVFFAGIAGSRLFYCIQYADRVFYDRVGDELVLKSLPGMLLSIVNLPDGGLVLLGGVLMSAAVFFLFCYLKRLKPLLLADIFIPAFFVGLGFGRLGCLMNGCCYGDRCELPWAIMFPLGSVPDIALVSRGFVGAAEMTSLWLHPSQIYSSLNAFILALLTAAYFRYRPRDGSVLGVGMLLYPVSRFTIEYLRGDELGQFNTPFTISQWMSIALFVAGLVYLAWLNTRPTIVTAEHAASQPVASAV